MNKLAYVLVSLAIALQAHALTTLEKLDKRMLEKETLVCVGLDPDPSKMPLAVLAGPGEIEERIYTFLTAIVDITADHVCAYKLQKAFFDDLGQGHDTLARIIGYIRECHEDIPLFVDCKIGDIDNTMAIYMHNLFDQMRADGVVINPYMGDEVFLPFTEDAAKTALVIVQTSNKGAKCVQELPLENGRMLWEEALGMVLHRWNQHNNLIPILSSNTEGYDYRSLREKIPQNVPILLAGIGAQGGNLNVLRDLLNREGRGVFVNSSRDILYPYVRDDLNWRDKVLAATLNLKSKINGFRYE